MTEAILERAIHRPRAEVLIRSSLLALIGVALLLRLRLLFVVNVNWDEFLHLGKVHSYLRGELLNPLQTAYVHAFAWLPAVSGNEVDQIIAARLVAYLFSLASLVLIYRIGRPYLGSAAALFAVFCYLAFSFVLEHGDSFRADPFATFFCLAAVYLVLLPSWRPAAALAGLAAAAALMVTIKSALYFPVIGILLLLPLLTPGRRKEGFIACLSFGLALGLGFACFYLLQRWALHPVLNEQTGAFVTGSGKKVIRFDRLFPGRFYMLHSVIENAVIWLALVIGAGLAAKDRLRGSKDQRAAATYLLVFLVPLLVFLIYRNSFPYFYAFILPLPMLSCGWLFAKIMQLQPGRQLRAPRLLAFGLCLAVAVNLGKHYLSNADSSHALQRATIDLVHKIFPEPVVYIDRCEMVSSHEKVGLFMSTWGMENYLDEGQPIFRTLLRERQPVYLLANIPTLNPQFDQERLRALGHYVLFDEDQEVLRANFVHHWGDLFVAGKTLRFTETQDRDDFEMLIPGRYTLESKVPIEIDGRLFQPGATIELSAGRHSARRLDSGRGRAILRWGDHLFRPADPAPPWPLFAGF